MAKAFARTAFEYENDKLSRCGDLQPQISKKEEKKIKVGLKKTLQTFFDRTCDKFQTKFKIIL
jgi:hypothetical protein